MIAGWLWMRHKNLRLSGGEYQSMEAALFVTSLLIDTFFRSTIIENNDLGWRVLDSWTVCIIDLGCGCFADPAFPRESGCCTFQVGELESFSVAFHWRRHHLCRPVPPSHRILLYIWLGHWQGHPFLPKHVCGCQ